MMNGIWTTAKPSMPGVYAVMEQALGPLVMMHESKSVWPVNITQWKRLSDLPLPPPVKPDPGWYLVRRFTGDIVVPRELPANSDRMLTSYGNPASDWREYEIGPPCPKPVFESEE